MSPQEAQEFITEFSNPESVNMDNLVQLYRMKQGGAAPVQQTAEAPAIPSPAFQQTQRAQQVPSPMGVMPSQSPQSTRTDADSIMDDLINSHKTKNPWT